ncbi:GM11942 [Drosophila sechellia]|uniref:GM11942 n=1 Tax=Drosophila sechellia TaxID=7238 RepID=B4HGY9_DROSE|nr:GM24026 [Drosophila sechellia]EDW54664.1 GM11942 [Drosophila sechellia]
MQTDLRLTNSISRLQRAHGARELHGLPAGRCAARGHPAARTVRDAGTALRRVPAQATDVQWTAAAPSVCRKISAHNDEQGAILRISRGVPFLNQFWYNVRSSKGRLFLRLQ